MSSLSHVEGGQEEKKTESSRSLAAPPRNTLPGRGSLAVVSRAAGGV